MKSPDDIATEAAAWVARRDAGFSREDELAFARWRALDPRHEAALKACDTAWTLLGTPATHGRRDDMHRLLAGAAQRRTRRRTAAAGAILALVVCFFLIRPDESGPTTARVVSPQKRVLSDGSVVELKLGAEINERYSAGMREVSLDAGEAHFEVQPDATRPFVVTSAGVSVRAVGTAFAVAREPDDSVEIVVSHGVVAVETPSRFDQSPASDSLTLEVGKLARLHQAYPNQPPEIRTLGTQELAERLGWRTARIEFSKATLGEAAALFNRHRPTGAAVLVVHDSVVRDMPVSGVFRADNAEAFVSLLETAFGLNVARTDTTITIGPSSPVP